MQDIQGLHHITAVAGDTQTNVDFYHHILGQRLIKTTVNFDDPGTYHLYYADKVGSPGTVMTFFPWKNMPQGRRGNGETAAVAYGIRPNSLAYWQTRLQNLGVNGVELTTGFGGEEKIVFNDPDGMVLELVATDAPATIAFWEDGPIPEEHALLGFYGVTLWQAEVARTAELLTAQMGYQFVGQEGNVYRYKGASNDIGLYIDVDVNPGRTQGRFGAGSVHHIAFRTVDDEEQLEYLDRLRRAGHNVTPVQDRQYFHSIYFRNPGGVLFEVATDAPGFLYDESVEQLGTSLKLPPWYEQYRERIEATLPPIERKAMVG